jgi:hypothetical protein
MKTRTNNNARRYYALLDAARCARGFCLHLRFKGNEAAAQSALAWNFAFLARAAELRHPGDVRNCRILVDWHLDNARFGTPSDIVLVAGTAPAA